jgi:ABC-type dipeptide/oligopeptide/nickel transport system permease component
MLFSMLVQLTRLISLLTCNVPAKWIELVCLVIFFTIVLHSLPVQIKHDSANAQAPVCDEFKSRRARIRNSREGS